MPNTEEENISRTPSKKSGSVRTTKECFPRIPHVSRDKTLRTYENQSRCSSKYSLKSDDTVYSAGSGLSFPNKTQHDRRPESQETVTSSRPIAETPDVSELSKLGSASHELFGIAIPGPSGFSGKSRNRDRSSDTSSMTRSRNSTREAPLRIDSEPSSRKGILVSQERKREAIREQRDYDSKKWKWVAFVTLLGALALGAIAAKKMTVVHHVRMGMRRR